MYSAPGSSSSPSRAAIKPDSPSAPGALFQTHLITGSNYWAASTAIVKGHKVTQRPCYTNRQVNCNDLALGQIPLILNRLMESNRLISKARSAVRCGVSDKLRNEGDEPVWPTGGRLFAPAELRCGPLAVGQTTARTAPRQQTRITGQTIQYERNLP